MAPPGGGEGASGNLAFERLSLCLSRDWPAAGPSAISPDEGGAPWPGAVSSAVLAGARWWEHKPSAPAWNKHRRALTNDVPPSTHKAWRGLRMKCTFRLSGNKERSQVHVKGWFLDARGCRTLGNVVKAKNSLEKPVHRKVCVQFQEPPDCRRISAREGLRQREEEKYFGASASVVSLKRPQVWSPALGHVGPGRGRAQGRAHGNRGPASDKAWRGPTPAGPPAPTPPGRPARRAVPVCFGKYSRGKHHILPWEVFGEPGIRIRLILFLNEFIRWGDVG